MDFQLEIRQHQAGNWTVLAVTGEIDLATAGELESAINSVLDKGMLRLVIDLKDVAFLDSTGLRVLLTAHSKLEESGGSLALVVPGGPVQRLLDVTGLDSTMNIYPSVEAAAG